MPTISMFYGIIVRMYCENNVQHNLPHIHAIYNDEEVVISLEGEVLEGTLPSRQMRMLKGWIAIHEDELKANWKMLSEGDGYFQIEPLK